MSGGVEIDLSVLGEDMVPGLRAEAGLDETRHELESVAGTFRAVVLYLGGGEQGLIHGHVTEVGAGVVVFEQYGDGEDERTIVPLNMIRWARVKRRA